MKKWGFTGILVIGITAVEILSWGFYKKSTELNSECDFVPPPSFHGVVQEIDIENSQMTVMVGENTAAQENQGQKNVILNCEKIDYKLHNTKKGDSIEFSCDEEKLDDKNVEIYNFTREK